MLRLLSASLILVFATSLFAQTTPAAPIYETFHTSERSSYGPYLAIGIRIRGGDTVVPYHVYSTIDQVSPALFLVRVPYAFNGKRPAQALYDAAARREISPHTIKEARIFKNGLVLLAHTDGTFDFLGLDGRPKTPRRYTHVGSFGLDSDGYAPEEPLTKPFVVFAAKGKGQCGVVDPTGNEIVPPTYDYAISYEDGYLVVTRGGLKGLVDAKGREVIQPRYRALTQFSNGVAAFSETGEAELDGRIKGGKWGFIDAQGRHLGKQQFDQLQPGFFQLDGFGKVNALLKGKWVGVEPLVLDPVGAPRIGAPRVEAFKDERKKLWGFRIAGGGTVVAPQFTWVSAFEDGRAVAARASTTEFKEGTKEPIQLYGVIDEQGREIMPIRYKAVRPLSGGRWEVATGPGHRDRQWTSAIIDQSGRVLIGGDFTSIGEPQDGLIRVLRADKVGYIDEAGKIVIPLQFRYAGDFYRGLAPVSVDGRTWHWINPSGEAVLLGRGYTMVWPFDNGRAKVWTKLDPWGRPDGAVTIDLQGKVLETHALNTPPSPERVKCQRCGGTGSWFVQEKKEYSVTETDYHSALAPGGRVTRTRSGSFTETRRTGDCLTCNGSGYVMRP